MLLGVREARADELVEEGHRLRIYVPYGEHWYAYSLRRLQENPKIAGYIAADTLGRLLPGAQRRFKKQESVARLRRMKKILVLLAVASCAARRALRLARGGSSAEHALRADLFDANTRALRVHPRQRGKSTC